MIIIPDEEVFSLSIDYEGMSNDLNRIERMRAELDRKVEETGKKSKQTFALAVQVAKTSYGMFSSLLNYAGITVSSTTQAVIDAAFAALGVLVPIFTAQELVPGMQVTASIGLAQVGIGLLATLAAGQKKDDIEKRLDETSGMLGSTLDFMGGFYFI